MLAEQGGKPAFFWPRLSPEERMDQSTLASFLSSGGVVAFIKSHAAPLNPPAFRARNLLFQTCWPSSGTTTVPSHTPLPTLSAAPILSSLSSSGGGATTQGLSAPPPLGQLETWRQGKGGAPCLNPAA